MAKEPTLNWLKSKYPIKSISTICGTGASNYEPTEVFDKVYTAFLLVTGRIGLCVLFAKIYQINDLDVAARISRKHLGILVRQCKVILGSGKYLRSRTVRHDRNVCGN